VQRIPFVLTQHSGFAEYFQMSSWQNDLDALVEESMAFARNTKGQSAAAEPSVEPVLVIAKQALAEPRPRATAAPMMWTVSQREEIKQRVANFKAHQLKMQTDREDYYLKTMSRTRAIIETTRHLIR
jgi:hypothetical protein